tara:strand:+ start:4128 stop:6359 length:2232 start_codon:yes stop_codon:yes gene_type:complete
MDYNKLFPNRVYWQLSALLTLCSISFSLGQSKEMIQHIKSEYNSTNLYKVSEEFNSELDNTQAALKNYARLHGLKLSETLENGNQIALVDIGSDGTPLYYSTFSDNTSIVSRANTLYKDGLLDLGISGEGMQVGVWDSGSALLTHQEYNSRVYTADDSKELSSHATMVLGSMISSGIKTKAKGVAYSATAISNDWKADKVEVINAAANGLLLSNHSYGIRPDFIPDWYFGAYIKVSQDWDKIMYNAPYYLMVTAAGNAQSLKFNDAPIFGKNSEGFDLMLGFSTSKNGINVAAVDSEVDDQGNLLNAKVASYSSLGPIDDGRIKPDIAGCGANIFSTQSNGDKSYDTFTGTSMAAPGITSTMLLLQQYYERLNSSFMKAATLKGLVLHSADDVDAPGPDYKLGWGVINAKNAAEIILNNEYSSLITEEELREDEVYSITVDAREGEALIASISWTDPAGTYVNTGDLNNPRAALVNDLDIRITKAGVTYYPWKLDATKASSPAIKGDNKVDPFEKIQIENASGSYTIKVSHKGNITNAIQNFSLIVSGVSITNCSAEAPKVFKMMSLPEEDNAIDIQWEGTPDSFFEVQYKSDNAVEWNTIFTEKNEIRLQGLTIGTNYSFKVRTNCTANVFSEFSETKSFIFNGSQTENDLDVEESDLEQEELSIRDDVRFSVHPNPTTETITIDGELSDHAYYSIVSSTGTLLKKGKADFKSINVNDLSTGFYSLTIFEDGDQQSMKFIKN